MIIGAVLGGVGIAFGGTAIGLPLLAVLGVFGLVAGAEVDHGIKQQWGEMADVQIPKELKTRLEQKANELGIKQQVLIVNILNSSLD